MSRIQRFLQSGLFAVLTVFGFGDVQAQLFDCFWGGTNETTGYSPPYTGALNNQPLANVVQPPMNLGTPPGTIPVQATMNSQSLDVRQASIPTITVPAGPVGSVGRPATSWASDASGLAGVVSLPPGSELLYVLPPTKAPEKECIGGTPTQSAVAVQVVPAGTPGAIPVIAKTMTVTKPKTEYRFTYSPVKEKTNTLVNVVDPRTGRVVRTYCRTDEKKTFLPYPHQKEVTTYETVQTKVVVPLKQNGLPAAASSQIIQHAPVVQTVRYPYDDTDPAVTSSPVVTFVH